MLNKEEVKELVDNSLPYLVEEGLDKEFIVEQTIINCTSNPYVAIRKEGKLIAILGITIEDNKAGFIWALLSKNILNNKLLFIREVSKWFYGELPLLGLSVIYTTVGLSDRRSFSAIKMLEYFKFSKVSIIKKAYPNGNDALLMRYL
jgi:hypothetical protein